MTVARLVWRKRNLRTLRIAELAKSRCWAIKNEKLSIIQVPILGEADPAKHEENTRAAKNYARKELGDVYYELAELGEAATFDGLTKELDIEERLDAAMPDASNNCCW